MSAHSFTARRQQPAALAALDFGLRVHIETHSAQRRIFAGAENLSAQELTSELSEMVSSLRVRSFSVRGELEQITSALMVNIESGFWPLARRAATDLGGLLAYARQRRLADPELCIRGANCAFRIAELCAKEAR